MSSRSASAPRSRSSSGGRASAARSPTGRSSSAIRKGSKLELVVDDSGEPPLTANAPDIPEEHRIRGFAGVRAYAAHPERSEQLLAALGFEPGWEARGDTRSGFYRYDPPPAERGLQAAGTVHHVAWASKPEEHEAWRAEGDRGRRRADAGDRPLLLQVDLLP